MGTHDNRLTHIKSLIHITHNRAAREKCRKERRAEKKLQNIGDNESY